MVTELHSSGKTQINDSLSSFVLITNTLLYLKASFAGHRALGSHSEYFKYFTIFSSHEVVILKYYGNPIFFQKYFFT